MEEITKTLETPALDPGGDTEGGTEDATGVGVVCAGALAARGDNAAALDGVAAAGSDVRNTPNGFSVKRLDLTAKGLKYLACTLVLLCGKTTSCAWAETTLAVTKERARSTVAIDRFVLMLETPSLCHVHSA